MFLCISGFVDGLTLPLNHLTTWLMANYDWPIRTLSLGILWSILDTRDFKTYPRIYFGYFWNMSLFDDSRAASVLFRKWVLPQNHFSWWRSDDFPLIGLDLGGQVLGLHCVPICFPIENTWGLPPVGCLELSTTFLILSWRVEAYLLLGYGIENQSIGVAWVLSSTYFGFLNISQLCHVLGC